MAGCRAAIFIIIMSLIITVFSGCEEPVKESYGPFIEEIRGFTTVAESPRAQLPGFIYRGDYFDRDHADEFYNILYEYRKSPIIKAQVLIMKYSGPEADMWLMHEMQKDFRMYGGMPYPRAGVESIEGNTVLTLAHGAWIYRWPSNNTVIQISYSARSESDADAGEKNVIHAYLEKYPSTLPPLERFDLRSDRLTARWIRDEMERLLWQAERLFLRDPEDEEDQEDNIEEMVNQLYRFQTYRDKYFKVEDRGEVPLVSLLRPKGKSSPVYEERRIALESRKAKIRGILTGYREWFNANRDTEIIPK